jgi:uncharacterized protein YjbI with pentapeptide repeats
MSSRSRSSSSRPSSSTRTEPIIIKSREDLYKIPKINGVYHLVSADLKDADLPLEDLTGAILNKAKLGKAHLIGAILEGSQLEEANLTLAKLEGANLKNANLKKAILRNAKLESANLQDANLKNADLESADLHSANLQGAKLESANLEDATLMRANLQGADLRGAKLKDADLRGAKLQGADLRGAKKIPENAKLEGAILTDEDYENRNKNNVWISDEQCSGKEDPITLEEIPADRGFRLKADENSADPDSLTNCFDVASLAKMMKLNKPLLSPLTRKDFTEVDKERIRKYIELHGGRRQNRKSNKRRNTKRTIKTTRKNMSYKRTPYF